MRRIRFLPIGYHPLLDLVKRFFIEKKHFECVGLDAPEKPDFMLVGGTAMPEAGLFSLWNFKGVPAFVLGTDDMYTIRGLDGKVREKAPMSEDSYTVISPLSYDSTAVASAIQWENTWLLRQDPTMLLRIFNVYGLHIHGDVVSKFLEAAREGNALQIHAPGFQTRTFLWEEDFLECVSKLVDRFLKGTTGIFNVGSDEEVSIRRLADSCWQAFDHPHDTLVTETSSRYPHRFWKLPDLTRTKAVTGWAPKTSLRKGLWRMRHESC